MYIDSRSMKRQKSKTVNMSYKISRKSDNLKTNRNIKKYKEEY